MTRQNWEASIVKGMWDKVGEMLGEQVKPRLLVGGKTGVGKSSILNGIMGKEVYETGILPTTKENSEALWESAGGDIVVVDVPGLGEANAPPVPFSKGSKEVLSYEENLQRLANLDAHLFLLVLKCDDRALDLEHRFIQRWQQDELLRDLPSLLVVNQIDKMKPSRDWNPRELNLKTPVTEKEKNIRAYMDYVASLPHFNSFSSRGRMAPVSAGESFNDPHKYGMEDLRDKIHELLPDSAKTIFARAAHLRKKEAGRIIQHYAHTASAAVAVNFTPASDALVLAPIQIAMIVHLGKLHRLSVTASTASGLLSAVGLSMAGRFTAQTLLSFFPGIKNVVGPALAFTLTYSTGQVVNELFAKGQLAASREELKGYLRKHLPQARRTAEAV